MSNLKSSTDLANKQKIAKELKKELFEKNMQTAQEQQTRLNQENPLFGEKIKLYRLQKDVEKLSGKIEGYKEKKIDIEELSQIKVDI